MKKINGIKSFQMTRIGVTVAAVFLIAGCSSTPAVPDISTGPAPIEQMAISRAAVKTANSAGSNEFAPVLLKSAMDKMNGAERAMGAMNYILARQLAEQAQVDAQLAAATANAAKAQKAADALREDNRVLRNEINRNPGR